MVAGMGETKFGLPPSAPIPNPQKAIFRRVLGGGGFWGIRNQTATARIVLAR